MKWLFAVLLLTSLAFWALMQWGGATGDGNGLKPQPTLNAEKITLLPAVVVPVSAVSPAVPSAVPPLPVCMEWGGFAGAELARATAAISRLNLGTNLMQRQVEHTIGYWVYLPPLKSSAEVDKKVEEIKRLGMNEYFVIQEAGKWQNAISLGVFKTEEAAHKFQQLVTSKGLTTAVVGERTSKRMFTMFVLKDPDSGIAAKMATLQKDFPDSELKAAVCIAN